MDLNPFHSALFTGKGTAWGEGPQDPYVPKYKSFDPNNYQGFDSSGLAAALRQGIGANTARATSRLQGQLQGAGGGGADAAAGLAGLQAEQGQAENTLSANLARQDWEDRLKQWQQEQGNEQDKANRDIARYQGEQKTRNAPWDFVGNVAGTALGAYLGGKLGGGGGSKGASAATGNV